MRKWPIILLCLTALVLSGCGRRGPLEPPPGAKPVKERPFMLDKLVK